MHSLTIASTPSRRAGASLTFAGIGLSIALVATAANAATKPVTITYWHAYSSDSPEVKALESVVIPQFQKLNPGIKVKDVAIPYDLLHQKLITAAAGGQLPDAVRSDIAWVPELAQLGVLTRLDKTMAGFTKLSASTFPGSLATNKFSGGYYGLPLDTNTRVMMWNSDALKAAGVTAAPKTFAEFRSLGAALKDKQIFGFADGGTGGWNILPWIWSGGGDITNPTYTTASGYLNGPKSVAAVQMLTDMYKDKHIPDIITGAAGGMATSDGLPKGKYATILDGPWMFPIFESQYPDFKLQTAPVPAGEGGSISVVGGEDVVMMKSTKHKAQTETFMRFLLGDYAQLEMAKVGQMSVRKDLGTQMTAIHPYYAPFIAQLATARPRIPSPNWPKIDTILGQAVQKAITGAMTTQAALDDAAKQIDPLLKS